MRMLPDNPSVDFLRREAKDLLASLRETEPTTSLSQAQQALAHQYGTASWPELRAEVDRRRSDPPRPDPVLEPTICEASALGWPSRMTLVSYQMMGRSWSLETDPGCFHVSLVFGYID